MVPQTKAEARRVIEDMKELSALLSADTNALLELIEAAEFTKTELRDWSKRHSLGLKEDNRHFKACLPDDPASLRQNESQFASK